MKSSSGFYSNSLEMLLDTMCNMLGAIIFIALMVALVAQDSPAPQPAEIKAQAAALSNALAAISVSNALAEADLQKTLLRLQDPHLRPPTNIMRLPEIHDTRQQPWMVFVRYGKLYPLDVLSTDGRGDVLQNNRALNRLAGMVEPRPGLGEDPAEGVAGMVQSFKAAGRTNYYFAFVVCDDSFEAFTSAREEATRLGFQYGWNPFLRDERLRLGPQGERVLPQN